MNALTALEVLDLGKQMKETYTDEDVELRLSNLPRLKFEQGNVLAGAYGRVLEAKQRLEAEKAMAHLEARKNDELTSEGDRKAWAITQTQVIDAEVVLIKAQGELKAAELKYQAIDDLFSGVRKLANIRIEQNRDQNNYGKYDSNSRGDAQP